MLSSILVGWESKTPYLNWKIEKVFAFSRDFWHNLILRASGLDTNYDKILALIFYTFRMEFFVRIDYDLPRGLSLY